MSSDSRVRIVCPECGVGLKIAPEHLGEQIECPKCAVQFTAKAAKPKAAPVRPREEDDDDDERPVRRGSRGERDEDDDRPRRKRRDDDDDDDDDAPRPGTCPECGSRKSSKVSFTWWGGLVGPSILGVVKCRRCSTQYAKGTGKRIGAATILIYSGVVLLISLVVFGGIALAAAAGGK